MVLVFALGSNGSGQLGIGHFEDVSVPKPVLWTEEPPKSILAIAAGGNHTLLLGGDGDLYWSGDSASGACGYVSSQDRPSQPGFTRLVIHQNRDAGACLGAIRMVAATWEASVFTMLDDQQKNTKVYSCGFGQKGELGQGPLIVRDPRATRLQDFPPPGTEIVDLAACMSHFVAVLNNGDVYGWGSGRKGQLGSPAMNVFTPRKIDGVGFPVKRAACGKDFTCLLGEPEAGRLLVLGSDKWGIKSEAPSMIRDWIDIRAGWGNILVLKGDKKILAWGRNDYSQSRPPPQSISQLAVGSEHALALLETGDVLAWGWGEHGNCGPLKKQEENSKDQRSVIASSKYLPSGARISGIGAGCATSWVFIEEATEEQA
ncbi:Regulator of chromosome condensation/beta-lactamase-inhibitor protein II [Niveomyces insectorum RCEF 264]|uniref:Regulator of chromosome condensation/beta-lactamase-inhibitor protein II n=1 Tax=Niveomyces insectorum RCEF 264 TaxID=1081102 RepID=A0A162JCT7_9HYPO|nr:Regulator of chromosome condensation/beta-lactamase-inhibitor protein II [Niveomyces insectorum RCEF 264]